MTLRYVLDEHLRGPLWHAIRQHNAAGAYPIDATRVGDPPDLPLGSADLFILEWAEREDRVVVSADYKTMPGHLKTHLRAGRHLAGLFIIRPRSSVPDVVAHLALAGHAADPAAMRDTSEFIPP